MENRCGIGIRGRLRLCRFPTLLAVTFSPEARRGPVHATVGRLFWIPSEEGNGTKMALANRGREEQANDVTMRVVPRPLCGNFQPGSLFWTVRGGSPGAFAAPTSAISKTCTCL